jgi:hypothetical protein
MMIKAKEAGLKPASLALLTVVYEKARPWH